jgi:hypothetical protein
MPQNGNGWLGTLFDNQHGYDVISKRFNLNFSICYLPIVQSQAQDRTWDGEKDSVTTPFDDYLRQASKLNDLFDFTDMEKELQAWNAQLEEPSAQVQHVLHCMSNQGCFSLQA